MFTGPEFGNTVPGVFTPVLAKHSKSFSLIDWISVDFEPLRKSVASGKSRLTVDTKCTTTVLRCRDECGPALKCRRAAQLLHNCARTGAFQAKNRLLSPPYVIESEQQAGDGFIFLNPMPSARPKFTYS